MQGSERTTQARLPDIPEEDIESYELTFVLEMLILLFNNFSGLCENERT